MQLRKRTWPGLPITVCSSLLPPASPTAAAAHPYSRLRQHARQRVAADRVDASRPALALERPLGRLCEGRTVDDRRRSESVEIVVRIGAPARGDDLVAEPGEEGDRHRSDAAGGAGDEHLAGARRESMRLECHDGEHRRESGGADRHGLSGGEPGGQRHEPVAVDRGFLRIAAPLHLADAPAGEHHFVARATRRVRALEDRAREVDAGHVRIALHQAAGAGHDEAILVVDRGVLDSDQDVAGRQARLVGGLHGRGHGSTVIVDHQCLEHPRRLPHRSMMGRQR